MLSRVAEHLLWISRYMERADNVARLIDTARRMMSLPRKTGGPASNEWASVLIAAGARDVLGEAVETADEVLTVQHLIFDRENPSSIVSCMHNARENARAIRFAITQESWEALNTGWSEMRTLSPATIKGAGLSDVLDWIKSKSANFKGATTGTMMRDDGYQFIRLGSAIERTDSTARLIDVKYHLLLPSPDDVGSGTDHYQWLSLLQASSAQRAFYSKTQGEISARGVAEFLILNAYFPRSIVFNLSQTEDAVRMLDRIYGQKGRCSGPVSELSSRISAMDIEDIFQGGLHEFLTGTIEENYAIANLLGEAYGFAPMVGGDGEPGSQQGQ